MERADHLIFALWGFFWKTAFFFEYLPPTHDLDQQNSIFRFFGFHWEGFCMIFIVRFSVSFLFQAQCRDAYPRNPSLEIETWRYFSEFLGAYAWEASSSVCCRWQCSYKPACWYLLLTSSQCTSNSPLPCLLIFAYGKDHPVAYVTSQTKASGYHTPFPPIPL